MKSKVDRLNDALAKGRWGKFHLWIYDALFGLVGGMTADVDAGYWAANKYARRVLRRRYRPGHSKARRGR